MQDDTDTSQTTYTTSVAAEQPIEAEKRPGIAFRIFKGAVDGAVAVGLLGMVGNFAKQQYDQEQKLFSMPKEINLNMTQLRNWTGMGIAAGAVVGGFTSYIKTRRDAAEQSAPYL